MKKATIKHLYSVHQPQPLFLSFLHFAVLAELRGYMEIFQCIPLVVCFFFPFRMNKM